MITFQCSDFEINSNSPSSTSTKKFSKIDYDKVSMSLRNIETEDILGCADLETAYAKLEKRVTEVVETCTTEMTQNSNDNQPWYDYELQKLKQKGTLTPLNVIDP